MNTLQGDQKNGGLPARTDPLANNLHEQAIANVGAAETIDVAKIIEAQSRQAIVFRQHFPPSFMSSLSYFGGAPTTDAGFDWPRWTDSQGISRPLTFIMQVDCSEIPPLARLGMMPDDGVLYLFMEISTRLLGSAYRVIYQAGPTEGWSEVPLPEDLPPAFSRYRCPYAMEDRQLPRVLPQWVFTPTVIEIPEESYAEREVDAPYLWPGISAEALRAAQGGPILYHPYSVKDFIPEPNVFRKPFEAFPHDWRAVQYVLGILMEKLEYWKKYPAGAPFDMTLPDEEIRRQILAIQEKVGHFYDLAAKHPADDAVPESQRDAVWSFLASEKRLSLRTLSEAVTLSVEDSLVRSPAAASLIPPEVAERIRGRHALIAAYEGKEYVNTPERMLAPPRDVQGGQWEWAGNHLLLLELSSDAGLGRDFGEGVCQLYIAPEDLKARCFDKVKLQFEAY